jgi:hypothetical protein
VLGCWGGWSGDVAPAEQGGAGEQGRGTSPTLGITRPARHRPSGHKLSRPHMPQGLSAHPPTAYPARPGRRPHAKAAGHVPQHPQARARDNARPNAATSASPVRRHPNRSSAADSWWQQNQGRRAASATTNAPAASSRTVPRLPKTGHSARADEPQTCPLGTPYSAGARCRARNRITACNQRRSAAMRKYRSARIRVVTKPGAARPYLAVLEWARVAACACRMAADSPPRSAIAHRADLAAEHRPVLDPDRQRHAGRDLG